MLGDIVDIAYLHRIGFSVDSSDHDPVTPAFPAPRERGQGRIYHAKLFGTDTNLVIGELYRETTEYYLTSFEGPEPMDMVGFAPEVEQAFYDDWFKQVLAVFDPCNRVAAAQLEGRIRDVMQEGARGSPTSSSHQLLF